MLSAICFFVAGIQAPTELRLNYVRAREASISGFANVLSSSALPTFELSLLVSEDGETAIWPFRLHETNSRLIIGNTRGGSALASLIVLVSAGSRRFVATQMQADEWRQRYAEAARHGSITPADVQVLSARNRNELILCYNSFVQAGTASFARSGIALLQQDNVAPASSKPIIERTPGNYINFAMSNARMDQILIQEEARLGAKTWWYGPLRGKLRKARLSLDPSVELPLAFDSTRNAVLSCTTKRPFQVTQHFLATGRRRVLYREKFTKWLFNGVALVGSKCLLSFVTRYSSDAECKLVAIDLARNNEVRDLGAYTLLGSSVSGRVILVRKQGQEGKTWLVWPTTDVEARKRG